MSLDITQSQVCKGQPYEGWLSIQNPNFYQNPKNQYSGVNNQLVPYGGIQQYNQQKVSEDISKIQTNGKYFMQSKDLISSKVLVQPQSKINQLHLEKPSQSQSYPAVAHQDVTNQQTGLLQQQQQHKQERQMQNKESNQMQPFQNLNLQKQVQAFPQQVSNSGIISVNSYLCMLILVLISTLLFYGVYHLFQDVSSQKLKVQNEIQLQITQCAKQYADNHCSPEERVPAIEQYCQELEKCIYRNPKLETTTLPATASVLSKTFGNFFQELSWINVICILAFFIGVVKILK